MAFRPGEGHPGPALESPPPSLAPAPQLDRNPLVDRTTARGNMIAGLLTGAIAAAVFALCFIAAALYLATG